MKKLAITIGDPGGIGPEVVVKTLPAISGECLPIVIGGSSVIEDAVRTFMVPVKIRKIESVDEAFPSADSLWYIDPRSMRTFVRGKPDKGNGAASVNYIKKAVELAMEKRVDGMVTAPISKEALKLAGFPWPGHTEMLAELTGTKEYAMMLTGGPL